jgi:hypothetical protein
MELSYPPYKPALGEMMLLMGRGRPKTANFAVKGPFLFLLWQGIGLAIFHQYFKLRQPQPY